MNMKLPNFNKAFAETFDRFLADQGFHKVTTPQGEAYMLLEDSEHIDRNEIMTVIGLSELLAKVKNEERRKDVKIDPLAKERAVNKATDAYKQADGLAGNGIKGNGAAYREAPNGTTQPTPTRAAFMQDYVERRMLQAEDEMQRTITAIMLKAMTDMKRELVKYVSTPPSQ